MKMFSVAIWALGVLVAFATVRSLLKAMANSEEGEKGKCCTKSGKLDNPLGQYCNLVEAVFNQASVGVRFGRSAIDCSRWFFGGGGCGNR